MKRNTNITCDHSLETFGPYKFDQIREPQSVSLSYCSSPSTQEATSEDKGLLAEPESSLATQIRTEKIDLVDFLHGQPGYPPSTLAGFARAGGLCQNRSGPVDYQVRTHQNGASAFNL